MEGLIPVALFGDLTQNLRLYERGTCACCLAVDAGLPTKVARIHLDFLHRLGVLTRIELRDFCMANPAWASSVLSSRDAYQRLATFPGLLPVYMHRDSAFGADLRDDLARQLIEITSMLDIWEDVVARDPQRLRAVFGVAVAALRRMQDGTTKNPLGRLGQHPALDAQPLHEITAEYLERVRHGDGGARFERYRVGVPGQLRVLFHLALAAAGEPLTDGYARSATSSPGPRSFQTLSVRDRAHLIQRLDEVLARELERPLGDLVPEPDEPPASTPRASARSGVRRAAPGEALYDGEIDWLRWRPALTAEQLSVHSEFLVQVLAGVNPDLYDIDWVEHQARELLPGRVEHVLDRRLERSTSSSPAAAFVA